MPAPISTKRQGINADTNRDGSGAEAFDLSIPAITAFQEAYVRKVIDAVNDLDNVLYEIGTKATSPAFRGSIISSRSSKITNPPNPNNIPSE